MTTHSYAELKARDTMNNLLDDVMADTNLTKEENLVYWQILHDVIGHTIKELNN